jgi:hypothetical protein
MNRETKLDIINLARGYLAVFLGFPLSYMYTCWVYCLPINYEVVIKLITFGVL